MIVLYRDMTEAQQLAWGQAESKARQADLAADRTAAGLDQAKANCKKRRKLIQATIGQATSMVIAANRLERIAKAAAEEAENTAAIKKHLSQGYGGGGH